MNLRCLRSCKNPMQSPQGWKILVYGRSAQFVIKPKMNVLEKVIKSRSSTVHSKASLIKGRFGGIVEMNLRCLRSCKNPMRSPQGWKFLIYGRSAQFVIKPKMNVLEKVIKSRSSAGRSKASLTKGRFGGIVEIILSRPKKALQ